MSICQYSKWVITTGNGYLGLVADEMRERERERERGGWGGEGENNTWGHEDMEFL